MAATTPKISYQSPRKQSKQQLPSPSLFSSTISLTPKTPQSQAPSNLRRSVRQGALLEDPPTPQKPFSSLEKSIYDSQQDPNFARNGEGLSPKAPLEPVGELVENQRNLGKVQFTVSSKSKRNREASKTPVKKQKDGLYTAEVLFSPLSPELSETKKRRRHNVSVERNTVVTRAKAKTSSGKVENLKTNTNKKKRRVYYKKVMFDGVVFEVGDDVYVKRREDASSDDGEPEVEECKVCFKAGRNVMIECDDCLGGFHLKCLKPPLKKVPEGDWVCTFCEARKLGKELELPKPLEGKKRARTMKEKLLSSNLWAAHIESLWKKVDSTYWCQVRWYMIPEETAAGRQPHNLRRELYRTNDFTDIEMESIIRHCFVKNPKEFVKANDEGDDVFLCEYEYDIRWHSFKRLAEIDNEENNEDTDSDEDWNACKVADSDTDEDVEYEEENVKSLQTRPFPAHKLAANSGKGRFFGLQKIGTKRIPEHVRCHKQTELERAKATLLLATLPKYLPCRNKEMEEITAFIKGAICNDQCLGRCLYVHGVPGTGKTMSVLAVMRNLKSEVEAGTIKPYCFVEVNGLKLASPENIYRVIYESLNGHRVGWKKALQLLNERFSDGKKIGKEDDRPCILLIDELDLLVTRNQSVLYNILDWPTKPHSKLIVIGIANTMDLPEKLLPRISSRMGVQRLCFGPYKYQQLQEIISSRLTGIEVFEKQAVEFASRKVAAISGDARRALEICRRAAEIADYRIKKLTLVPDSASAGKGLVGMADVEAAIQEMFQAPHIQVMKSCSKLSKILLTAMVYELYKTGMSETNFEKLAMTVSCLCASNGETFPGWDTLLKVGCKLGECRIILSEPGSRHTLQKLQLNFPSDDVAFALKDSKELPWLAKYL